MRTDCGTCEAQDATRRPPGGQVRQAGGKVIYPFSPGAGVSRISRMDHCWSRSGCRDDCLGENSSVSISRLSRHTQLYWDIKWSVCIQGWLWIGRPHFVPWLVANSYNHHWAGGICGTDCLRLDRFCGAGCRAPLVSRTTFPWTDDGFLT